jgi:hypothetical protein
MKHSWYSFLLEAESNPGPYCGRKDYVNEKIPITPSATETTTFRLVAQCLNQLLHQQRAPFSKVKTVILRTQLLVVVTKQAIPLQAWREPEGSRRLKLPDFKTVGT